MIHKVITLFLFLLILSACSQPQPTAIPPSPTSTQTIIAAVTEADKAKIVEIATGYGAASLIDPNVLFDSQNNVILSTEDLKAEWIPQLKNFTIHPLTRVEIQEKAEAEGELMFLLFEQLDFYEDGTAEVVISSVWAAPRGGDIPLTGGGALLSFRRIDGEWQWQVEWEMNV